MPSLNQNLNAENEKKDKMRRFKPDIEASRFEPTENVNHALGQVGLNRRSSTSMLK